ncbi:pali-domain-containing protein [Dendrothele bispora CBS 962.96]|uniref:Pali-domain-containing protein n=1 Tax=Dendrothele bispora (strain CBS 962.96) TaxID=1314807 RepID=A0A4S8MFW0_DENBC|nr:pali-domain-containing protein [Dendrothele bispora CBS 962.96]
MQGLLQSLCWRSMISPKDGFGETTGRIPRISLRFSRLCRTKRQIQVRLKIKRYWCSTVWILSLISTKTLNPDSNSCIPTTPRDATHRSRNARIPHDPNSDHPPGCRLFLCTLRQIRFFPRSRFEVSGQNGTITFGTLGYCLKLNSVMNCSSPRVGYELDINSLIDNETPISIPQVAVKWLTYALVLHTVAFVLAGASTVFGLLAHVCQIVGTCCSTCVSGFSATVALLAFIFDIALFTIAKKRINTVNGSATTGNARWLTLAAFLLLVFTGCFYAFGSCCVPSGGGSSHGRRRSRSLLWSAPWSVKAGNAIAVRGTLKDCRISFTLLITILTINRVTVTTVRPHRGMSQPQAIQDSDTCLCASSTKNPKQPEPP